MFKSIKRGIAITALSLTVLSVPAAAFAEAAMDFQLSEMNWVDGAAVANGTIINTGDQEITKVNRVDVKIYLDDAQASDVYFDNIDVHLLPGESLDQQFIFPDIDEDVFAAATTWSSEETDWEFTYLESEADAEVAADEEVAAEE